MAKKELPEGWDEQEAGSFEVGQEVVSKAGKTEEKKPAKSKKDK